MTDTDHLWEIQKKLNKLLEKVELIKNTKPTCPNCNNELDPCNCEQDFEQHTLADIKSHMQDKDKTFVSSVPWTARQIALIETLGCKVDVKITVTW